MKNFLLRGNNYMKSSSIRKKSILKLIVSSEDHVAIISGCTITNSFSPLSANLTKWSNTLKQFVGNSR